MNKTSGIEISDDGQNLSLACTAFAYVTLDQWQQIERYLKHASGKKRVDCRIFTEGDTTVGLSVNRDSEGNRYLVASFSQENGIYNSSVWDSESGAPLKIVHDSIVVIGTGRNSVAQISIKGEA